MPADPREGGPAVYDVSTHELRHRAFGGETALARSSPLQADLGEMLLRKEVIQPHLPVRLPCYDFTPVEDPTVVCANKTTKNLCGTSGTQKPWVIIGPMLRAKPIPRV